MSLATTPQERAKRQTRDAVARYQRLLDARDARADPGPRVGDVYALAVTRQYGVEWVVLETGGSTEQTRLIAADTRPVIGIGDVVVPADAPCGPLILRAGHTAVVPTSWLENAPCSGTVEDQAMREAALSSCDGATPRGAAIAEDAPAYDRWVAQVLAPTIRTLTDHLEAHASRPARPRGGQARTPLRRLLAGPLIGPLALAASIALVLGFAVGSTWRARSLHHDGAAVGRQAQPAATPLVNLPFAWLRPEEDVRGGASVPPLVVPADGESVLLIVELGAPASFPAFRLELYAAGNPRSLWSHQPLYPTGVQELSVVLPRRLFDSGDYRLALFGLEGDLATPLAGYRFSISLP